MDPRSAQPFGLALRACFEGDDQAELIVRRDDGFEARLGAHAFFREPAEFTPIERAALGLCVAPVLDAGAGSGLHSLFLQRAGARVTALDIAPQAVEILLARGVQDARCADLLEFEDGPYETLLLLGHGIGLVETIAGLDRFLLHARRLLAPGGQVLLDSLDARLTTDPAHLAYHEANRRAGRYFGETRLRFAFGALTGPPCGWLHVDPQTLGEHAAAAGWTSQVVRSEPSGDYLARLAAPASPPV